MNLLRAIWDYRSFIYASVLREFRLKFSGSALGFWWMILGPLSQVLMYTIVLSSVMKSRLPGVQSEYAYVIYLLAGMSVWFFFSEIVTRSTNIFIENANLLKKLSFPRITLPINVAISALLNHAIFLIITILVVGFLNKGFGWQMLALFPLALVTAAFSLSLGVLLGVLNVFYRDVGFVVGIVIQFWFWSTPIVYTVDILPSKFQSFVDYNPIMPLINGYHNVIYLNLMPDWLSLIKFSFYLLILAGFTYSVFRRAQAEIVDAL